MKQYRLSDQQKIELVSKFKTGKYTFTNLSKDFNISLSGIKGLLNRRGYKAKSQSELQRKYPIDETFFDIIDTQEKAYFLGILYADGYNNTDRNSVSISLQEKDKIILEKLTNLLQPTKPLQYVSMQYNRDIGMKASDQYRLVINNKYVSQKLSELGCVKAKTFKIKFPQWLDEGLKKHFVRGYFDGDGCVSNRKFSMVGTEQFLNDIQGIFINELKLNKTKFEKRHKQAQNNILSIVYCGSNNLAKIYRWFYDEATIYLERKKIKFEEYASI